MKSVRMGGIVGLVMLGAVVGQTGCSSASAEDGEVVAKIDSRLTDSSIKALNGTYSGCTGKTGAWSVRVSGTDALTNPALAVVMNDTACQLSITEIVADQVYTGVPALPLGAAYSASASVFTAGATSFKANAKVSSAAFAADFDITLVHTDDPGNATDGGSATGQYATVQTSTVTTLVPASDYTFSLTAGTPLAIQMDVNKSVVSVSGVGTLQDGTKTGAQFVVDRGTLPATGIGLVDINAAWLIESTAGRVQTISGANPTISAATFGLAGVSLASNVVRTVIVSRTIGGVVAYQVFRVTFKGS